MPVRKLVLLVITCNLIGVGLSLIVLKIRDGGAKPRTETAGLRPVPAAAVRPPAGRPAETKREVPPTPGGGGEGAGGGSGQELYMTGYARLGMRLNCVMSDGTTRTEQDNKPGFPQITRLERNYADYGGKRYWFKPHERPAAQASPPTQSGPLAGPLASQRRAAP